MKRSLQLLAIGAFALLPLGLSQPASAQYWGREAGLERDIARDQQAIRHDFAERDNYADREREALRHGHYFSAWWFKHLRHHEEREIDRRRADIHRDHEKLDRYRY
jgi:hypothetical protein